MPPSHSPGAFLTVSVERLSLGGEGVAHADGQVVFVPYAVPGDLAEVEVVESQARFVRAKLLRIITPGADRQVAPCPYHFRPSDEVSPETARRHAAGVDQEFYCGGCNWQQIRYAGQLDAKRQLVKETLERIGGLRGIEVRPTLGMNEPWRYRNKVQQPVGWDAQRREIISGFFAPGSHEIVPIDDCLVQPQSSVDIVRKACALVQSLGIRAYDESRHTGELRHLLVRTSSTGEAMLTFVTRTPELPRQNQLLGGLIESCPQLVSIYQNINPSKTNVILGRRWELLAGQEFIEENLGPLRFGLSAGAFFQVNSPQAAVLYNVVKRMAGSGERLLDLYCGVGGIALWLADQFGEVGGVEENAYAIADAEANAEHNQMTNAFFVADTVDGFLDGLEPRSGRGLTVTLDPPRSGMTPQGLRALANVRPDRIIYVSCDPGTLARDLAGLVHAGYDVKDVQPVDMFPQTAHIETAVRLERAS